MFKFLFPFICGLAWMWRGYSLPKFIHGYLRAFITSFIIIGYYCLLDANLTVFSIRGIMAVVCLTVLEGIMGYGKTCELIDDVYVLNKNSIFNLDDRLKEPLSYLGFVGMSYYLFPYMILNPFKPTWVYIFIAAVGFRIFPLNKLAQLKSYNTICQTHKINIPFVNIEINYPFSDPWKIVEGMLGMGFAIWLSGVIR